MDFNVIKDQDVFLVTETTGNISSSVKDGYGLYKADTRFLSEFTLLINGKEPRLLSSRNEESYTASFYLMKEVHDVGSLEVKRERFIYAGVLYEKLSFRNYFLEEKEFDIQLSFDVDFQDMFMARNYRKGKIGRCLGCKQGDRGFEFSYIGLDEIERKTIIEWNKQKKQKIQSGSVVFPIIFQPKEEKIIRLRIIPLVGDETLPASRSYQEAKGLLISQYEDWRRQTVSVQTDDETFNHLFHRSAEDLRMLLTNMEYGDIPVAGLPWYASPFGRDSLITALFMLPLKPEIAKNTIQTLANYQGRRDDSWRDEETGKIMHELRRGELSNTKQIPFNPYYGSVDATTLFLMLIAHYYHWTKDLQFVKQLLPNIERAFSWIDNHSDRRTGFLTYFQEAKKGFPNQGWKDSANSIIHNDGYLAEAPIALIEVQAYVFAAKNLFSYILPLLGKVEEARRLKKEARYLKEAIEEYFWLEEDEFYAIALDKNLRPVRSITSNVGHLLFADLLCEERVDEVIERLFSEDLFSGYGIRTMGMSSTGYNPQSYHNGSVWPHDNGLILLGLNNYKRKEAIEVLIDGLLRASKFFKMNRLPELFCGYSSALGYPISYPTTCSPQAWAAATTFSLLQGMLGLRVDGLKSLIYISPTLPKRVCLFKVKQLFIGKGYVDLRIVRESGRYVLSIINNTTGYKIIHEE